MWSRSEAVGCRKRGGSTQEAEGGTSEDCSMLAPKPEPVSDSDSHESEAEMWSGRGAEGAAGRVRVKVEPGEQQPAEDYDMITTLKHEPEPEESEPVDVAEEWRGGEAEDGVEQTGVKFEIEIFPVAQQKLGTSSKIMSPEHKPEEPELVEDNTSNQKKQLECSESGYTEINHTKLHKKLPTENLKKNMTRVKRLSPEEKSVKNVCSQCGKRFRKFSLLTIHMRTHTGEKPYKCTECSKCFSSSGNLCTHKHTHTGIRRHKCTDCSKTFTQSSNLRRHIRRSHTGEKRFECAVCHKYFDFSCLLRAHIRSHTGERPYKCPECDKKFINVSTLTEHKKTHTGEKPFQCSYCEKRFCTSNNFRRHVEIHTEQYYVCTVCNKTLPTAENFRRHKKTHIKKNIQV